MNVSDKPIQLLPALNKKHFPYYEAGAACGFPSPAADYLDSRLSLDDLLIKHESATFFARAQGKSMEGVGIFDGDILIVDRALKARSGDVVMCLLDGELCVKLLMQTNRSTELHSAGDHYQPLILQDGQELAVWGVVVHNIHTHR